MKPKSKSVPPVIKKPKFSVTPPNFIGERSKISISKFNEIDETRSKLNGKLGSK